MRTGWYLVMVLSSVVLAVVAVILARQFTERLGAWNGRLLAAFAYVVALAVVIVLLPGVHETPPGFSADDLYEFRLVSLGTQLLMWTSIGVVFGTLAGRLLGERAPAWSD
jgi:uncharacterized membrane protein YagU involved in acid resistance